ncbi:hypothetical protein PR202_ga11614 [Eleusine coracana subsp. coracana]|uniref:Uncharacterized protein n=1 Tax=Eleusine coracana subsp. coracana TaxID=191504 RepID=A0AAV5C9I1_ELECO|nr:hypothetical protein PR202_ga11614 [Eleusine coracana subsp. coracana]
MGSESTLPLKKHEEDKNDPEASQVVNCTKSIDTVCDPEFYKDDVAEAVTPRADILELIIATETRGGCLCTPKKKVIGGAEVLSRRQLNFESGDYPVKRLSFGSDDAEEEDQYLLVLENMILDLIMPNGFLYQAEKTKTTPIDLSPKTPDSKPLLTGIATTCPDAPMRSSLKALKLSPSICRKIDFDSVSDSVYHGSSVARDNN